MASASPCPSWTLPRWESGPGSLEIELSDSSKKSEVILTATFTRILLLIAKLFFSGESANAKEFALISQLDLSFRQGVLWLSAPGRDSIAIDPEHLQDEAARRISMKLYDVQVGVLLLGEKYDEFVTDFVTGSPLRKRTIFQTLACSTCSQVAPLASAWCTTAPSLPLAL